MMYHVLQLAFCFAVEVVGPSSDDVAGVESTLATPSSSSSGLQLHWDAPDQSCPGEAELLAELATSLGAPHRQTLVVHAQVVHEADTWVLTLDSEAIGDRRRRSLSASTCAELAMAMVPIIELAMTEADAIEPPAASETPAQDEPIVVSEPVEIPQAEAAPIESPSAEPPGSNRRRGPRLGVRLQPGLAVGDLPGVGPILRLGLLGHWTHARVEAAVHHAFMRHPRLPGYAGAELRQTFAVMHGCGLARVDRARLEFPICAGLEAGGSYGQGVDLGWSQRQKGASFWLAVDLGVGFAWVATKNLVLGIDLEPRVALWAPAFVVDGTTRTQIWASRRMGLRSLAGVELRF